MRGFAVFMSSLLSLVSGLDALEAQGIRLASDPFREELQPTARISGALVTGLQRSTGGQESETPEVRAYVPSAWAASSMCVKVVSVNGLYESANEYDVAADWPGGIAMLDYPTEHGRLLSRGATDSLAVRVARGSCAGAGEEISLAHWNSIGGEPISLLVNSFRAESVFAYIDGLAAPVRCVPVELDGRSAYDTKCELPAEENSGSGSLNVELLRIVNKKPAPPTKLTIWLPSE